MGEQGAPQQGCLVAEDDGWRGLAGTDPMHLMHPMHLLFYVQITGTP